MKAGIGGIEQLLGGALDQDEAHPPTSRYHGIGTLVHETATEKRVAYLRRRFLPPVDRFELLREHRVEQGERLDTIAYEELGDPELFWRICDANAAMRPHDLTSEAGTVLRITHPEGIPGARHD